MKGILSLIIAVLLMNLAFAQPALDWQKSIGGSSNENAFDVHNTSDGNLIIFGTSSSSDGDISVNQGMSDVLVMKVSLEGDIIWEKTYGGSLEDYCYSGIQTMDNGYIFLATSESIDGDVQENIGQEDYWVVKLSQLGEIEWQKSIGTAINDMSRTIIQTVDGGYALLVRGNDIQGSTSSADYLVIKLSSNGEIEWEKQMGGSEVDLPWQIIQDNSGNLVVSGYSASMDGDVTSNSGSNDAWIVKLNILGDIIWEYSFGGTMSDRARGLIQTSDGGYLFSGYSFSSDGIVGDNNGQNDAWLVKLTGDGTLEWNKNIGGSQFEFSYGLKEKNNGSIVCVGSSYSSDFDVSENKGGSDLLLFQIDNQGELQWQLTLGGEENDFGSAVELTPDQEIIVVGDSFSSDGDVTENNGGRDGWIIKLQDCDQTLDTNVLVSGNTIQSLETLAGTSYQWINCATGDELTGQTNASFTATETGEYAVVVSNGGCQTTSECSSLLDVGLNEKLKEAVLLFPNPAKNFFNLNVVNEFVGGVYHIYSAKGSAVLSGKIAYEETRIEVNKLSLGHYILQIKNNDLNYSIGFSKE